MLRTIRTASVGSSSVFSRARHYITIDWREWAQTLPGWLQENNVHAKIRVNWLAGSNDEEGITHKSTI
jgi:hypothetical protein